MRYAPHGWSNAALALLLVGFPSMASAEPPEKPPDDLALTSPAFRQGEAIPSRYAKDGEDVNPALVISGAPRGTSAFALIVDDPDAPSGTWVHWVVWNIPPDTSEIAAGQLPDGAVEGRNSWNDNVYGGPSPPSGTHRYFFRLFALDTALHLSPRAGAGDLRRAMKGHVLAEAELMGTYRHR